MPSFSQTIALRDRPNRRYWITAAGLMGVMTGFFLLPTSSLHNKLFYVVLLLPLVLNARAILRAADILHRPLFLSCGAFLLYLPLTSLFSVSDASARDCWDGLRDCIYVTSFILVIAYVRRRHETVFDRILDATLTAAASSALLSIVAWVAEGADFAVRIRGISRTEHATQAPAAYAVLLIVIAVKMFGTIGWRTRVLYIGGSLIFACYIVLAQSRGVILALIPALCLLRAVKGRHRAFAVWCAALLCAVILAVYLFDLSELWSGLSRGANYRAEIWMTAWESIRETPLLGHGLNSRFEPTVNGVRIQHTHNIYLGVLYHGGAIGLVLYLSMVFVALSHGWRNRGNQHALAALLMLVFSGVFMLSDVANVITNPREVWLYFWLPIGILCVAEESRRKSPDTAAQGTPVKKCEGDGPAEPRIRTALANAGRQEVRVLDQLGC